MSAATRSLKRELVMHRLSTTERKKRAIERAQHIKLILLDVDGVLTDGSLVYGNDGTELKVFNVHDGFGIRRAIELGLRIGIITGRQSEIVRRRAAELGITDIYEDFLDKLKPYAEVKSMYGLKDEEVAYMGDELFDISLLKAVGLSAAPSNARSEVRAVVYYVTRAAGGNGAVRELIELILMSQGRSLEEA